MAKQKITLCWYAKVGSSWRYFPALFEEVGGIATPRIGWVRDKGVLTEYPVGRFVLRSYKNGRKVYTPIEHTNPGVALASLNRARKNAASVGSGIDPKKLLKTAPAAYIKDCKAQGHMEAAEQGRLVLDEFVPLCEHVQWVKDINRQHVLAFHQKLRERGCSPRTVANKDGRLRAFLRFCGYDTSSLPAKPKYEEQEAEMYTPAELKALLDAADEYMGTVIRMLLMLGLREQELMYAEWSDLDFEYKTFRVQGKPHYDFAVKDYAQRLIPVPDALLKLLAERKEKMPGRKLIVGNDEGEPEGHLLRKLKQLARKADLNCNQCSACGKSKECERWYLHKFRATFCTLMLRQTDPATVMKVAGHSNLETTMRYLAPASHTEMQAHANAVPWLG